MRAIQLLHNLGRSIWLDNITRDLINSGTLKQYIADLSVTGLTSNPTIFDHAIKNSTAYDSAIREQVKQGKSGEALFFELALDDITRAADIFSSIYDKTNTVDGWTSLEVSLRARARRRHGGRCHAVRARRLRRRGMADCRACPEDGTRVYKYEAKTW
jgi:transaldolase